MENSIEELKDKINYLQDAVDGLQQCGLRKSLLYIAIQKNSEKVGFPAKPIPLSHIKAIIGGIEDIKEYMFPE